MIRWVDAQVSPLDLLEELAPETEIERRARLSGLVSLP